jgi:hypothetical protein
VASEGKHQDDDRVSGANGGRERVESKGQSTTAQGAPLVAEEGVNEGTSELLEQAPERPETDIRSRPGSPPAPGDKDDRR